ncbi:MAG: hypothetical protein ACYS74_23995 [Planctomycetota bacterium]|jgi:hypothetical protein
MPTLEWYPGDHAASHQVYFGSDEEAVRNADTASPEYKTGLPVGSENYEPDKLDWDTTYYWRVDEVNSLNPESPWTGRVWSFTTADFLIVDDFEDYNDWPPNEIYTTWLDGYENPANGGQVGYLAPNWAAGEHYVETVIVHGGAQSMPLFYSNIGGATYSQAERTFAPGQDWTEAGVQTLVLYVHGTSGNTGQLYVKVNGSKVFYDGGTGDIQQEEWKRWSIDLASFGVNLLNVTTLSIGIDGTSATTGGTPGDRWQLTARLI